MTTAFQGAGYDLFPINPTSQGWAAGDREVLCAIYRLDGVRMPAPLFEGPLVPER